LQLALGISVLYCLNGKYYIFRSFAPLYSCQSGVCFDLVWDTRALHRVSTQIVCRHPPPTSRVSFPPPRPRCFATACIPSRVSAGLTVTSPRVSNQLVPKLLGLLPKTHFQRSILWRRFDFPSFCRNLYHPVNPGFNRSYFLPGRSLPPVSAHLPTTLLLLDPNDPVKAQEARRFYLF
jgi:hypothetical protein